MKNLLLPLAVAFVSVSICSNAFSQAGNASVGGFVQDSTNAYIPGVTVTATNTQTGVVNSTTPFGNIDSKGNQRRQFKAQMRFNF
jgi:hypothetical protein